MGCSSVSRRKGRQWKCFRASFVPHFTTKNTYISPASLSNSDIHTKIRTLDTNNVKTFLCIMCQLKLTTVVNRVKRGLFKLFSSSKTLFGCTQKFVSPNKVTSFFLVFTGTISALVVQGALNNKGLTFRRFFVPLFLIFGAKTRR